ERVAPDQQTKSHIIAIGERKLDLAQTASETQPRQDNDPLLFGAVGAFERSSIMNRGDATNFGPAPFLNRMNVKLDMRSPVETHLANSMRMQRRSLRAGVDLGEDGAVAKLRQRDPFAPADLKFCDLLF